MRYVYAEGECGEASERERDGVDLVGVCGSADGESPRDRSVREAGSILIRNLMGLSSFTFTASIGGFKRRREESDGYVGSGCDCTICSLSSCCWRKAKYSRSADPIGPSR